MNLWTAAVDVEDVTRIDFADCEPYGRTADELVGEDYSATQALADAVQATGAPAMVVPSAALPGIYADHWLSRELGEAELALATPEGMFAQLE